MSYVFALLGIKILWTNISRLWNCNHSPMVLIWRLLGLKSIYTIFVRCPSSSPNCVLEKQKNRPLNKIWSRLQVMFKNIKAASTYLPSHGENMSVPNKHRITSTRHQKKCSSLAVGIYTGNQGTMGIILLFLVTQNPPN